MSADLYLKQLLLGPMANFVYLVGSKAAKRCYVVDPAWDVDAVIDAAAADGMTLAGALVTHYHPDHCGGHLWGHDIQGVAELQAKAKVPIYAHADEIDGICTVTGLARTDLKACRSGDTLDLGEPGGPELTFIHTPGHTPGSQCFLCDDALVSGDTLFITGCGRVDLPGGDSEKLYESLSEKLAKLPPGTRLYPGHNEGDAPSATLSDVARVNPYFKAASLSEWRRLFGAR